MRTAVYVQHFAGDLISFGKVNDRVGENLRPLSSAGLTGRPRGCATAAK